MSRLIQLCLLLALLASVTKVYANIIRVPSRPRERVPELD
nr:venom peptide [Acharia stimulea]